MLRFSPLKQTGSKPDGTCPSITPAHGDSRMPNEPSESTFLDEEFLIGVRMTDFPLLETELDFDGDLGVPLVVLGT